MEKKKYLFLILLILSKSTIAQYNLHGKVKDKSRGQIIPGVSIFIPEYRKTVISDRSGIFSFDGLGTGIVKVQATYIGYRSVVVTKDLSENSEIIIEMEPSSTELEEV